MSQEPYEDPTFTSELSFLQFSHIYTKKVIYV